MNERMTDERFYELWHIDLRTHAEPDIDDIVAELQLALKAERQHAKQLKAEIKVVRTQLKKKTDDFNLLLVQDIDCLKELIRYQEKEAFGE